MTNPCWQVDYALLRNELENTGVRFLSIWIFWITKLESPRSLDVQRSCESPSALNPSSGEKGCLQSFANAEGGMTTIARQRLPP